MAEAEISDNVEEHMDVNTAKARKARAKTLVTQARHKLSIMMDDPEVMNVVAIREQQQYLSEKVSAALEIMEQLLEFYQSEGDRNGIVCTEGEMEKIESEFAVAMATTQKLLEDRGSVSSVSSPAQQTGKPQQTRVKQREFISSDRDRSVLSSLRSPDKEYHPTQPTGMQIIPEVTILE